MIMVFKKQKHQLTIVEKRWRDQFETYKRSRNVVGYKGKIQLLI
jgi:hypothetical protein